MPLRDLHQRQLIPELMDQPDLDGDAHRRALRALSRINRISNSVGILYAPIRELARAHTGTRPLRVLDVACGGADVTTGCAARAEADGLPVVFEGCDMSDTALKLGEEHASARGVSVNFFRQNVIDDQLPEGYDIVMSSLFLHHLEEPEALQLLSNMRESCGKMLLVNDIIRCRTGLFLAHFAGNVFTRSPVVRFDAQASVRGAFTIPEVRRLAEEAGLLDATVQWRWPWRYLLSWTHPHERST